MRSAAIGYAALILFLGCIAAHAQTPVTATWNACGTMRAMWSPRKNRTNHSRHLAGMWYTTGKFRGAGGQRQRGRHLARTMWNQYSGFGRKVGVHAKDSLASKVGADIDDQPVLVLGE